MEAILFILFGSIAVGASIMVVTRKHPLSSALHLILAMAAVAALFVLREAHFLAAVQMIVYAGAVIVLFVFVIMLTNVPEDRLPVERATLFRVLAVIAAGAPRRGGRPGRRDGSRCPGDPSRGAGRWRPWGGRCSRTTSWRSRSRRSCSWPP